MQANTLPLNTINIMHFSHSSIGKQESNRAEYKGFKKEHKEIGRNWSQQNIIGDK